MSRNRIFRTVFSVTGIIFISKLLGFVKQVLTASTFGATIETDLISLSEGLIGDIKYVIVQVLLTAFVSIYIQTKESGEQEAKAFVSNALRAVFAILLPVALVIMLTSPWLAKLLAPSYDAVLTARLAGYLRIFAPLLLLFGWIAVFQASLDANKRFLPGQLEGFNQSLIQIALIVLLAGRFGVQVLVISFFASVIWNSIFLGTLARRYLGHFAASFWHDPAISKLAKMTGPLLLGYSLVYVNQQVDKILVSGLPEGTVTAMGYAAVLSNLLGTVIVAAGSILFPYMTERIARGEHEQAAKLGVSSAMIMLSVFLPVSILTVICAEDIVSIVYGRGAFSAENVHSAAMALSGYGVGCVGLVLREVFSRLQYGYQDSKWPMLNSSIGILCNIALSIMLCPVWGVFGVALASSVSVLLCGILNVFTAKRKNEYLHFDLFLHRLPRMVIGGAICVLAARFAMRLTGTWHPLWRFALCVLLGFTAFGAVMGRCIFDDWRFIRVEKEF